MNSNQHSTVNTHNRSTSSIPIFTPLFILASVCLFFLFPQSSSNYHEENIINNVVRTLDGSFWEAFLVHFRYINDGAIDWVFLLINLLALSFFGITLERRISHPLFFWILASAMLVVSVMQISLASLIGIGALGIITSLYAFTLLRDVVTKQEGVLSIYHHIAFVVYLALYFLLYSDFYILLQIIALVSAFFWGGILALLNSVNNKIRFALNLILLGIVASFVAWSPFSVAYDLTLAEDLYQQKEYHKAERLYKHVLHKKPGVKKAEEQLLRMEVQELSTLARQYHIDKNYSLAMHTYQVIIQKDPTNEYAQQNYHALRVYNLSQRAYKLHILDQLEDALKLYKEILVLDPNNQWAKEAMAEITLPE